MVSCVLRDGAELLQQFRVVFECLDCPVVDNALQCVVELLQRLPRQLDPTVADEIFTQRSERAVGGELESPDEIRVKRVSQRLRALKRGFDQSAGVREGYLGVREETEAALDGQRREVGSKSGGARSVRGANEPVDECVVKACFTHGADGLVNFG